MQVVLVDKNDKIIGEAEKLEAHQTGVLHRAFSIFLFNEQGKILMQKRASTKYHSPNLWTNACCSHPNPDEDIIVACNRRLTQELGIVIEEFKFIDKYHYCIEFDNGLTENEIDYIFFGKIDSHIKLQLNPKEVEDCVFESLDNVFKNIEQQPHKFTYWFVEICKKYKAEILKFVE